MLQQGELKPDQGAEPSLPPLGLPSQIQFLHVALWRWNAPPPGAKKGSSQAAIG